MHRPPLSALAFLLLGAAPLVAQPAPAAHPPPPAAPPRMEDLGDLRAKVAQGKFRDAAALSTRVVNNYALIRDHETPQTREWAIGSCMVDYCLFAEAQVLALNGDGDGAQLILAQADSYHSQHVETQSKGMTAIWQELDAVSHGMILEAKGDLPGAIQAYLQAPDSAKCSSRLALAYFKRGQYDQAHTWALFHPEEPTAQYVLAQLALRSKNSAVARQYANRAAQQLAAAQKGKELMPAYFCEAAHIYRLRAQLAKAAAHRAAAPTPPSAN